VKRGEIYVVDLGPSFGTERGGVRPVVVISSDVHNLAPYVVLVVVGEDAATVSAKAGVLVPASESGASSDIVFFFNQIRTLDPSRLAGQPSGVVPPHLMDKVSAAVKTFLDLK
jgi:mRNA interferase MazF